MVRPCLEQGCLDDDVNFFSEQSNLCHCHGGWSQRKKIGVRSLFDIGFDEQ